MLFETARAITRRDPAAHSLLTVLLTYPGVEALAWYRLAHCLQQHRLTLLAETISRHAGKRTGILINPAAQIGRRVFFDHGIGTVIGETAIIEDDVTIMHGVTLGSRHPQQLGHRHPHIQAGAFIGAYAQILGPVTIGVQSKVGAGAIVLNDVTANSTVIGNLAHQVELQLAQQVG